MQVCWWESTGNSVKRTSNHSEQRLFREEVLSFTRHIYMTLTILCRRRHKVAIIAELNLKFSSRFLRQRDACGMVNSVKDKLEIPHCTAVVLAAGSGKRMHSQVAKQFMTVAGKPLIY